MKTLYTPWRSEQAKRHFPLDDYGPPITVAGRRLPEGLILDANIHPANSPGEFYLAAMEVLAGGGILFDIGDGINTAAASGTWAADQADPSAVQLFDSEQRPAGVLVIDPTRAAAIATSWAGDKHVFVGTTSRFVVSVWDYTYVPAVEIVDNAARHTISDDLHLVGDAGVRLSCDTSGPLPLVRVHAIGDPLARLGKCDNTPVPRFIREVVFQQGEKTIACEPGELGEIYMLVASKTGVDSSLRLYSKPGDLQIGFAGHPNAASSKS